MSRVSTAFRTLAAWPGWNGVGFGATMGAPEARAQEEILLARHRMSFDSIYGISKCVG